MRPKSLDDIFGDEDPHGLLEIETKQGSAFRTSEAEQCLATLNEGIAFVVSKGRPPVLEADDFQEHLLATKLAAVARNPAATEIAAEDVHGLLDGIQEDPPVPPGPSWRDEVEDDVSDLTLDDIFGEDDFEPDVSLTDARHVTPAAERKQIAHRGEQRHCEDYDIFRPLFEDVQAALDRGDRTLDPYTGGSKGNQVQEGDFFVLKGLIVYVAEKGEGTYLQENRDHRMRLIYSNGTESDVMLRTFQRSLGQDETARRVSRLGFGPLDPNWEKDKAHVSGYIYVARSQSTQKDIQEERHFMHKIGVTSGSVKRRVADARNDPTFLYAPVDIVMTFELQNMKRDQVEFILHKFFEDARVPLKVPTANGKVTQPREWFRVTPDVVADAVKLLKEGRLAQYYYNIEIGKVSPRSID